MTGAEHYREAERLAEVAYHSDQEFAVSLAILANTHATLAVAAATALGREGAGRLMPGRERQAWFDVAGETAAADRREREAELRKMIDDEERGPE